MLSNYVRALKAVLAHEGGYVNNKHDPGGPTNKGVTIGTLKSLGIDVDGDGDSDLVDLKTLRYEDVARVYKLFYWDKVMGDYLPDGVDYAVFDYAVNSGPEKAIKDIQRALEVSPVDGDLGPITIAAIAKADKVWLVNNLCDRRLVFLKGLKGWKVFGRGWATRVGGVRSLALDLAKQPTPAQSATKADIPAQKPAQPVSVPKPPKVAQEEVKPPVASPAPVKVGWAEWARRLFA